MIFYSLKKLFCSVVARWNVQKYDARTKFLANPFRTSSPRSRRPLSRLYRRLSINRERKHYQPWISILFPIPVTWNQSRGTSKCLINYRLLRNIALSVQCIVPKIIAKPKLFRNWRENRIIKPRCPPLPLDKSISVLPLMWALSP